jgi:hypothetical protein
LIQPAWHLNTGRLFGTTSGLLAYRFRLGFHREIRQLATQALLLAKGGPKLQASKDQDQKERVSIRVTDVDAPSVFTALEDLGLKLETRRGPVKVFVDRFSRAVAPESGPRY